MDRKMIECQNIEFKREFSDKISRTIVAFANTNGGRLFVGIDDNGEVIGVNDIDTVQLSVKNILRDSIRPDVSLFTTLNVEKVDGKYVLRIDVGRGTLRPYYLASHGLRSEGVYIRQGASNEHASEQTIREMILSSMRFSYEREPSMIADLTFDYARDYFSRKKVEFGESHFHQLGFSDESGGFTNLALLFSDQNPHLLKIAEFASSESLTFADRREIGGSILRQLEMAYDTLSVYNRKSSEIKELDRIDTTLYSQESIREALVNSIVHCDYSQSAPSRIEITDKYMDFINLGGLVEGLSVSDLELGASKCRNERLAFVFYRLKLVESYGTGLRKILNHYPNLKVSDIITVSDHTFRLRLPIERPNVGSFTKREDIKTPREKRQHAILGLLAERGVITRKLIQKMMGYSLGTTIRDIEDLLAQGKMKKRGNGRTTEYVHG